MDTKTSEKERLVYVLWGYDTFSSESYTCGVYRHRSSANRAMRKHEKEVEDQDPSVRDMFGISVYTESYYQKMQIDKQKVIVAKSQIKYENQTFVSDNAQNILQKLKELAADKEFELYIKENMGKAIDNDERPLVDVPDGMYIKSIFLQTYVNQRNEILYWLGIRMRDIPYAKCTEMLCYIECGTFDDFRKEVNEKLTTKWICEALHRFIEKGIYDNNY